MKEFVIREEHYVVASDGAACSPVVVMHIDARHYQLDDGQRGIEYIDESLDFDTWGSA